LNPKIGLVWSPTRALQVRMATFKTFKRPIAADQTIEPTQVAGFNQFFDDFNSSTTTVYGVGIDAQLLNGLYAGLEYTYRDIQSPSVVFFPGRAPVRTSDLEEQNIGSYVYWTPFDYMAVQIGYDYEYLDGEGLSNGLSQLRTHTVPVSLRFFHPRGLFAGLGVSYVSQDVDARPGLGLDDGSDMFALLDLNLGYRFPRRHGFIAVEVANVLDEEFRYLDNSFRTSEVRSPRFVPDRQVLARVALTF
jgi:TonB dependent receptor